MTLVKTTIPQLITQVIKTHAPRVVTRLGGVNTKIKTERD